MTSVWARRLIELRHSWPVRFAHHPLCGRHRHETWQIGGMYLCRGCLSMGAGLVLGTASVLFVPGPWTMPMAATLAPIVFALSWPAWYAQLPRKLRDLMRLALGLLIAIGSFVVFSAPTYLWPILPLTAGLWWLFKRARKRVQASRCNGCPELGRGVCSGYALQVQAMRAIEADLESRLELSGTGEITQLLERKR